jgi:hypothetical protein
MLARALKLIEAIQIYCFKNRDLLQDDTLSPSELEDLKKLIYLLQAFSDATQASDGRYATVDLILPIMDFLRRTRSFKATRSHVPFLH